MSRRTQFIVVLSFLSYLGALCLVYTLASAHTGKPDPRRTEFETLVSRIRDARFSQAWKQADWRDEVLEKSLKEVVARAAAVTKKNLDLPIDFADTSAQTGERAAAIQGGMLRVLKGSREMTFVNRSILLVDGSIRIAFASECVVIARGAVEISHCNHCIVFAGHHINIGHDGNSGFGAGPGGQVPAAGSIVVSGGSISIAHADGSVVSAPISVVISHAKNVDFIASPNRDISHQQGCSFYDKVAAPLAIPQPETLPSSVFAVKQVVSPDDHTQQRLTVRRNGIEYVLRPTNKIADENGAPIDGWNNWNVGFLTESFALFTDGLNDVSVRTPTAATP